MPRRSLSITTLRPGEVVTLHVSGRGMDRIRSWTGRIVAVDGTAVRIVDGWYRFGLGNVAYRGQRVIPWRAVESITVEAA